MFAVLFSLLFAIAPVHAGSGNIKVNVAGNPGEIILDGFLTGKTAPALLEDVAVGSHHVELNYGCMSSEADVDVNPGQTTVVNLRMKTYQGNGTLRLRGLPNSGTVFMDGRPVGNPDEGFAAQCGGREISVEAPGFEIWTAQVVVTRDKWSTVEVEMVPGELDSTQSVRRRPPPGVDVEDDFSDFEDDLADLDPVEEDFFASDDEPPPLDLSTIDVIGGLDDSEYEEMDEASRAERNRRRLEEAEARERDGVEEWEPNNPSERELERAREYEEEQRRKAAGLDDDYFDVEQKRGVGGSLGGSSLTGKLVLGGSAGMVIGGTTLAILKHQKYKDNFLTYQMAFPECIGVVNAATGQAECSAEGVAYYDGYVWPQQKGRAMGIILGGVGIVGSGAGWFLFGSAPDDSASIADKAAARQARTDAKAAKAAEKRRKAEEEAADSLDIDELDVADSDSGGVPRIVVLGGAGALVAGGAGWGYYEHTQYKANELTYLTVWPECVVQCTADGVAYYDSYVWPHQRNRIIGFSVAGIGLVGAGVGMLATRPTQVMIAPTQGGFQIGLSSQF